MGKIVVERGSFNGIPMMNVYYRPGPIGRILKFILHVLLPISAGYFLHTLEMILFSVLVLISARLYADFKKVDLLKEEPWLTAIKWASHNIVIGWLSFTIVAIFF